jgi:light-regulated signal transduction histidine kinase (bacteriophytochrome)
MSSKPAPDDLIKKVAYLEKEIERLRHSKKELHAFAASLEQNNRDLQDFVYITAHDLQEPLNLIQAFGERLHSRYGDSLSDHGRRYLERIENTAIRMQNLIKGLLMYSRITSEAQSFVDTDLSRLVQEVLADLEVRIEQSDALVEVGDLPVLSADPLQIRQLFQNLISNALKFRRAGTQPRISISCCTQQSEINGKEHCVISVKDNGIGFDAKYKNRIFSIFQRLHNRTEFEGTGIGLTICKMIAERHDGTIDADGVPGTGATFTVTLPFIQSVDLEPLRDQPDLEDAFTHNSDSC